MWETAVRKQASDFLGGKEVSGNRCLIFWGGNRCRETGVWIRFQETGVGKQVSCFLVETGVGKQVSCFLLETGVRETGVWIQLSLSIECPETDVKVSNVTCTFGEKVSGYKCPDNSCLGNR